MGGRAITIELTTAERAELEGLAGRGRAAQGLAKRARIVLAAALCPASPGWALRRAAQWCAAPDRGRRDRRDRSPDPMAGSEPPLSVR